ncbi:endonuclease domain-containing protein [Arthrobacter mobilis]|uniref:DUF559 domain-containing protein n=1 Tax=Arthrobacter mobilis TaxID=2724944 RepID=A0A7X6HCM0_9MICC|nr:hypothetical protein [Arthrobacter mobilis]NKX54672.1 hypothetical protein [Arthrobacter mobilis]
MRYPKKLPDHLSGTSFSVGEGLDAGLTRNQLLGSSVRRPSRSLRAPAGPELDLAVQVRALSWITSGSAISHATAARIWGFPLPAWMAEDPAIHVTRPDSVSAPRRNDVVGHHALLHAEETTVENGVRLTTRPKTWLDLASRLSVDDLVVTGDHLVRLPRPVFEDRADPYATKADLERLIQSHKRKRGVAKAREALELVRMGADSAQETRLRLALAYAGLPEPELNTPLLDLSGRRLHSPDLQYSAYRIAIEYEGDHHRSAEQLARDIRRGEAAARAGWLEIRISREDMLDDARPAVRRIRQALYARGWRPSSS